MIDTKDIDWNLIWKCQVEENRASSPSRESALRFWNMCRKERSRIDQTVWETDISQNSRVLDIGAGPGTLAIPFAQKAEHVTAIEPAEGMCSVMKEKMAEFGLSNIDIVQKRWEDVDIASDLSAPYDVVIASFSLGMKDIQSAVEKMVLASSRYVYLYHFAGPSSWDIQWQILWPRLHGKAYRLGPKSNVLYNVLYQMGIYPNIRSFRLEHNQPYASLDEAMAALVPQAQVESEEQKALLKDYLRGVLKKEDGKLVLPGSSIRVKIWWDKSQQLPPSD